MLCRNGMEAARIAVALVPGEGQVTSSDSQPSAGVRLNIHDEPDRARIAGGRSCSLLLVELCFEPSAKEPDPAA